MYTVLGFSPVTATGAGYHEHKGVKLDEQLDDWSPAGIAKQRQFFASVQQRLAEAGKQQLTPDSRADWEILSDQVGLNLLEIDTIQNYKHNPTVYVEQIGNALFSPYVLEYAPKNVRLGHIISRLEKIPAFFKTAQSNLVDAPEVWNRVAREENEGTIGLIDKTLRAEMPADLKPRFEKAAEPALAAMRGFNEWLEKDLSQRTSDWRLGKERYGKKYAFAMGTGQPPEALLKDAEAALEINRNKMLAIAKSLPDAPTGDLNTVVRKTLDKIGERHSSPETYMADARRDLDEVRRAVQEQQLVTLPVRANLQVIETPEFMRGIYGVGGFNAAPPLQPELGAFYWITPIPKDWPAERVESKLREYNFYGLKLLTIHEAIPGHWVQLEYANDVAPISRRLLRAVFGSGPYVEGWAVYATEATLDGGYLNKSPELRLVFLKQQLRMIANTILDIRMQTMNMSDDDAMRLMLDQTFQEKEEAVAKLQRAKLSSTQLPTYYAGYREWIKLRDREKSKSTFRPIDFHERALKVGAVPMRVLGQMLEQSEKTN
ncbi:MAG: DUF885 domain-containing protein [Bryobacteraceae bacterium]